MTQPSRFRKLKAIGATASIVIGLFIIILFMFFKKTDVRGIRRCCRLFFPINGFKLEILGEYDLEARLLVANHQSLTDIICLEANHPLDICWVAKKELESIPVYGHALKIPEMIFIDRGDKRDIVNLLKEARDRLSKDRPLVIFPEGTRSIGDQDLLSFKPGAKILAEKFKLRIQPVLMVNTRKLYHSNPVTSQTDVARMVLMPAFMPDFEDSEWYSKLRDSMVKEYKRHYFELNHTIKECE